MGSGQGQPWGFARCGSCGFAAPLFWTPTGSAAVAFCPACGARTGIELLLGDAADLAYGAWMDSLKPGNAAPAHAEPGRPSRRKSVDLHELSDRARKALSTIGIRDIERLDGVRLQELNALPGIGRKTLDEIAALCGEYRLRPPADLAEWPEALSAYLKAGGDPAAIPPPNPDASGPRAGTSAKAGTRAGKAKALSPYLAPPLIDALDDMIGSMPDSGLAATARVELGLGVDDPKATLAGMILSGGSDDIEVVLERFARLLLRVKAGLRRADTDAARWLVGTLRPLLPADLGSTLDNLFDLTQYLPTYDRAPAAVALAYLLWPHPIRYRTLREQAPRMLRAHLDSRFGRPSRQDPEAADRLIERIAGAARWPEAPRRYAVGDFPWPSESEFPAGTARPDMFGSFESRRADRGPVRFRSRMALSLLQTCDVAPTVRAFRDLPPPIEYRSRGEPRVHAPDLLLVLADGRALLVDVRPVAGMFWLDSLRRGLAAQHHAARSGWGRVVVAGHGMTLAEVASQPIEPEAEATLLAALERAGGDLGWAGYREIRREHGIGTAALSAMCARHDLALASPPWRLTRLPAGASWSRLLPAGTQDRSARPPSEPASRAD